MRVHLHVKLRLNHIEIRPKTINVRLETIQRRFFSRKKRKETHTQQLIDNIIIIYLIYVEISIRIRVRWI